jgi:hypothetical protein
MGLVDTCWNYGKHVGWQLTIADILFDSFLAD